MIEIKSNNHHIEISNPDKIMFPDTGLTKSDLVTYYQKVSRYILPYLINRPLTMHRYPDGIEGQDFFQKDMPDYFPDWIPKITVTLKKGGTRHMVNCLNEETLIYIVGQATITPHIWLSAENIPDHPDRLIFDLDPPEGNFRLVQQAAFDLRDVLNKLNMKSFVMTTGSEGMHILVPLDGKASFEDVRGFSKAVADHLAAKNPDDYTTEMRIEKRNGRLFLDYLRNAYGQTSVTPYALRALKEAPVATPLDWEEALRSGMTARKYHYGNIFRRLAQKCDPWSSFRDHPATIDKAIMKFAEIKK